MYKFKDPYHKKEALRFVKEVEDELKRIKYNIKRENINPLLFNFSQVFLKARSNSNYFKRKYPELFRMVKKTDVRDCKHFEQESLTSGLCKNPDLEYKYCPYCSCINCDNYTK